MPIEVKIEIDGNSETKELDFILPGKSSVFADTSDAEREVISVFCLPDDTGGQIHRFPKDKFVEPSEISQISPYIYPEDALEAEITEKGKYECDLEIPQNFQVIRFIFKHVILQPSDT